MNVVPAILQQGKEFVPGQMFSELGKEICEAEWNENEPSVGGDEDEIYKLFLDISRFGKYRLQTKSNNKRDVVFACNMKRTTRCGSQLKLTNFNQKTYVFWYNNHNHAELDDDYLFNNEESIEEKRHVMQKMWEGKYVEGHEELKRSFSGMLFHKYRGETDVIKNLATGVKERGYIFEEIEGGYLVMKDIEIVSYVGLQYVEKFAKGVDAVLLVGDEFLGMIIGGLENIEKILAKIGVNRVIAQCDLRLIKALHGKVDYRINSSDVVEMCGAEFGLDLEILINGNLIEHMETHQMLKEVVSEYHLSNFMSWKQVICDAWNPGSSQVSNRYWWRCHDIIYGDFYDVDISVMRLLDNLEGGKEEGIVGFDLTKQTMNVAIEGKKRKRQKVKVGEVKGVIDEIMRRSWSGEIDEEIELSRGDKKLLEEYERRGREVARVMEKIIKKR